MEKSTFHTSDLPDEAEQEGETALRKYRGPKKLSGDL